MKALAGALANRWYAMRALVGNWMPPRAVGFYSWLNARLDRVSAPTTGSATADWALASALTVVGPLLFASLLLAALCGGGLWSCAPAWHDEMWYFNEMSVFEYAGMTGGYTVCQEWPARADWVRFGTHGPFAPVVYGTFAHFTDMHLATIPMLNAILLVLGSLFWVVCCRVNERQAWVAALVAMTYWPMILYIPTSMQEGLHLSIAFVLAALSVVLIRNPGNKWVLLLTLLAVAAAAQTRVTWAWVAIPVLWVFARPRTKVQMAAVAAVGLAFVAVLHLEAIVLVSPYPNFMKTVLDEAFQSPLATFVLLLKHSLKGIEHYLAPNHDTILQVAFRYQVLIVAGAAIYQIRKHYLTRSTCPEASPAKDDRNDIGLAAYRFALLNLLCIVGFVIVFYDVKDWRDYRVVAPHLLLALMVLVGCGALDWLKRYAIIALAVSVLMVVQFREFHRPRVAFDAAEAAPFAAQVGKIMKFDPAAPAWDNTMLMDMHYMDARELLFLPRGIGISTILFWEQQDWPPKSKYVLLTRERAQKLEIPAWMHKVAETRIGDIYIRR